MTTGCEQNPLWYDCDSYPCADCPYRICQSCRNMRTDCGCNSFGEYDDDVEPNR